jgi:dTMP kinase
MARAIARGEDRLWIEQVAGFALVPHAVYYLRAEVKDLVSRVVLGRGAFDFWESGMDMRFGADMHQSFVRYQARMIRALDGMAKRYGFTTVDASQPSAAVFQELQNHIRALDLRNAQPAPPPRKTRAPARRNGKR